MHGRGSQQLFILRPAQRSMSRDNGRNPRHGSRKVGRRSCRHDRFELFPSFVDLLCISCSFPRHCSINEDQRKVTAVYNETVTVFIHLCSCLNEPTGFSFVWGMGSISIGRESFQAVTSFATYAQMTRS